MATKIGTIYALITADKRPLDKALKGARKSAVTGAKKIQTALSKINFKAVAIGMAAAGAAGVLAMKKFVALAIEQEKVEKRLETVLRATGEAAGYNITQLKGMAAAMQDVTTMGDETILAGMGILATFKQIRGEAFERTTMAALDLSEVMQQDLRSSIVMLGKALNDPIANLGALGRAGVQFSVNQKKVIKTMWEMGQTAKAQEIILDELESQFGGTAKAAKDTLGGALKSLGNTFGDIGEKIGTGIKPMILSYVESTEAWVEANNKLLTQDIPGYIRSIGDAMIAIKDFASLTSVLETSAKAAALIKSGVLEYTPLQWDSMGYIERQKILEDTLEKIRLVEEHEFGRRGEGKDLTAYVKFKTKRVEPLPLPAIPEYDLKLEKLDSVKELNEMIMESNKAVAENSFLIDKEVVNSAAKAAGMKAAAERQYADEITAIQEEIDGKQEKTFLGMESAAADTASTMARSFSTMFVDTVTGEFTSLKDYAQNMFKQILSMFIDMATRMAMTKLFTSMGFMAEKGAVVGMAKGGIVNKPTLFPFAGGTGLMGEAGPEGILPLARTADGDLGVQTAGGGGQAQTIINRFEITALDAKSFVELAYNTPEAIIGPFTQEIEYGNRNLISKLKGI